MASLPIRPSTGNIDDADRKPKSETVDLKPKFEPEDRKPKLEAVDRKPNVRPLPPLQSKADVWIEVVGILQGDQAYRTISHLAVANRNVNTVVQPRLKKMKRKIVLDLDDLMRLPEARWKEIEIIECTELSRMPYDIYDTDDQVSIRVRKIHKLLRPFMIAYRGHPHPAVMKLRDRFFPVTPILRIMEDSSSHVLRDIEAATLESREWLWTEEYFVSAINAIVRNARYGAPLSVRYVLHGAYQSTLLTSKGGQQQLYLSATTIEGDEIRREMHDEFLDEDFQDETLIHFKDSITLPGRMKFDRIVVDYYIQLYRTEPGCLFATSATDYPEGYRTLSRAVDQLAERHLDGNLRGALLNFRFFVVQHGKWQDRTEMVPVYSTVCGMQAAPHGRATLNVLERTLDRDFTMCIVKGGCNRCRAV